MLSVLILHQIYFSQRNVNGKVEVLRLDASLHQPFQQNPRRFDFRFSTFNYCLSSEPRRFFIPVNVSLDMLTMERRGSQPAPSSHPPGHGRTKSVGQGMGMGMGMGGVPMSLGGSGSPVVGAEVEWADIQARYVVPVSS